ncbi:MAG: prephenate dehydrogenase/arogenate dehydrogenase family protein, partial [Planctomycetota bacterium]|nr:prephenate dehydrogenase/arogenate dehydrogenase family protein [Planctomycetota bacterium]
MEHPNQDNPVPPDLLKLRTRIDGIDHQILDLLVKRNEVIKEVAFVKQQTGFEIRDFTRERALLANRGKIAETGGLRREVIESLFRVILWASRDKQASLNAALPTIVDVKTVGIIGGLGGIGSLLKTMFEEVGHTVLVADIGTELSNIDVASQSDVVVIAVPIEVTIDVIDEIGKHCREDSLLIDVTSTKTKPVAAMCNQSTCSVVGTHPLFGPSVHSLQGQRIALVPERVTDEWLTWLEQLLSARGLSIILTTSKEH